MPGCPVVKQPPLSLVPPGAARARRHLSGAAHVIIGDKRVLGNDSLDMIVLQNFLASADSRIEPNSDFVQVRGNVVLETAGVPTRSARSLPAPTSFTSEPARETASAERPTEDPSSRPGMCSRTGVELGDPVG